MRHSKLWEDNAALIGVKVKRAEMWEGRAEQPLERGEQPSTREGETSIEVVKCSVVWHAGVDSVRG